MSVLPLKAVQLTRAQLVSNFDLDFTIDEKGQVRVPLAWEAQNLVTIKLPIGTHITANVRLHKRAAPVFQEWFRSWDAEACKTILAYGGSFVPRLMRMAKNLPETKNYTKDWASYLSRHSRGVAMDLNHSFPGNKQGSEGIPSSQRGSLVRVCELAREVRVPVKDPFGKTWEAGIVCGVDWNPLKVRDPMHFEIGIWK